MYMIALGFIVFAGCTLSLVVDFIKTLAKSTMGGDAAFWVLGEETLNENLLRSYLTRTINKFPNVISNYTFISSPVNAIISKGTGISSLNGYPGRRRRIDQSKFHLLRLF